MSDFEVLQTYASWAGTAVPDKLPGIPFADLDVFEDREKPEKPALLSCAGYLLRRTALLLLLGGQPVC